jgi:hypothetical protein
VTDPVLVAQFVVLDLDLVASTVPVPVPVPYRRPLALPGVLLGIPKYCLNVVYTRVPAPRAT